MYHLKSYLTVKAVGVRKGDFIKWPGSSLILVRMELTFFTAAHVVLCFDCNTLVFCLLPTECQGSLSVPLCPAPLPQMSRVGVDKKLGGYRARRADPNWQGDIPYHIMYPLIKAQAKEGEGSSSWLWHFSSQATEKRYWGPAFWELAKDLPADGK